MDNDTLEVIHTPTQAVVVPGSIVARHKSITIISAESMDQRQGGAKWRVFFGGPLPIETRWYSVDEMIELVREIAKARIDFTP
jgi:hypothetical protein